jgi:hypothetical protein
MDWIIPHEELPRMPQRDSTASAHNVLKRIRTNLRNYPCNRA